MARKTINTQTAQEIMGKNFIGPEELKKISQHFKTSNLIQTNTKIPPIPFDLNFLKKNRKEYILILGTPQNAEGNKITLNHLRSIFGLDPHKSEPCFYNQDWYVKEEFADDTTLKFKWYLIKKSIDKNTRGKSPENILKTLKTDKAFPSAILTAFTFFSYYLLNNEILWKNDFLWCSDKDKNGDRIYTGRYIDPNKINKNGFNIHRHLSIRPCYGLVPEVKIK